MSEAQGLFLVIDGPDGAGKTTQAGRLVDRLVAAGRAALYVREPGGTPAGERIRAVLLDPDVGDLDAMTELFLYQAARRRIVIERIVPALEAGRVVVADRWHYSTFAYQARAGGVDEMLVRATSLAATGGLEPRRAVLLDVEDDVARGRMTRPLDRIERRGEAYRARVLAGFRDAFRGDPDRFRTVDGGRSEDEVAADVWDAFRDLLE